MFDYIWRTSFVSQSISAKLQHFIKTLFCDAFPHYKLIAVFAILLFFFTVILIFDMMTFLQCITICKMIYKISDICIGPVSHLIFITSQFKKIAFCVEYLGINK